MIDIVAMAADEPWVAWDYCEEEGIFLPLEDPWLHRRADWRRRASCSQILRITRSSYTSPRDSEGWTTAFGGCTTVGSIIYSSVEAEPDGPSFWQYPL